MISEEKCRCCEECPGFKKMLKLKNTGLALYRYSPAGKDATQEPDVFGKVDKATSDVFIIRNTTSVDISKDKYMSQFAQYTIKCPRCKYIFEHARKLLEKTSFMKRYEITGICEHCQAADTKSTACSHCCEVIDKFITIKKQKTKKINEYFMLKKLKDYFKFIKIPYRLHRSLSELYLNRKCDATWSTRFVPTPVIDRLLDFTNLKRPSQIHVMTDRKSESRLESKLNLKHDSGLHIKQYLSSDNINMIKNSDVDFDVWQKKVRYQHIHSSLNSLDLSNLEWKDLLHRKYNFYSPFNYNDIDSDNGSNCKIFKIGPMKSFGSRGSHQTTKSLSINKAHKTDELENSNWEHAFINADRDADKMYLHKEFNFVFNKTVDEDLHQSKKYKSSSEIIMETKNMIQEREKKEIEKKKRNITENEMKFRTLENINLARKKKKHNDEKKGLITKIEDKKIVIKASEKNMTEKPLAKSKEKVNKKFTKDISKVTRIKAKKKGDKDELQNEKEYVKPEKPKESIIEKNEKFQKHTERKFNKKNDNLRMKKEEQNISKVDLKRSSSKENRQKSDEENKKKECRLYELKKMMAEQKKQKEETLKLNKNQEEENKKNREWAEDKGKNKTEFMFNSNKETKLKRKIETKTEVKVESELKINQVVIQKPSSDDLILKLVKLKKSDLHKIRVRPNRLSEINIDPGIITAHKDHKFKKLTNCIICNDSELELDIENIVMRKTETKDIGDIIIGQKIFKHNLNIQQKKEEKSIVPKLFTSFFQDNEFELSTREAQGDVEDNVLSSNRGEQEVSKGVIRYALSDRTFIDKGWTMLPTEKIVRKMNVYRMRPAHPEFDWFQHNKDKKIIYYDTGEKLAEFDYNGKGRWFYRNGKLALDYYDAEEINAQQRFVIYSSGELDERGRSRPLVILATFDYLGNGIVFDHAGKIRLKYNQTEGVVLDKSIGPISHWKWHTLNDPPVLQQIMIDTQMAQKDPEIFKFGGAADEKTKTENEEMLAIEFDNFLKEKSKKLSQKFKPFQIKMKALKINEHFSLKVLDQATVYLIFRDGSTNLKINIGMLLDHQEIVDTDTAEVGEVSNSLERFPARTDSLAGLQKNVAYAQRVERARVERDRRLRPAKSCASADRVNAVVSRPLRPPFRTVPSSSTATSTECMCKCRKLTSCNLYYDTRLP